MAKRLAELGALQDAVSNDESSPKRLALAGYIRGLFLDWSANPYNPLSRLTARGRLLGYFWDSGAIGLSMNFADQNYLVKDGTVQSKSFSQIVNFSRTTNATVTNSAGQITYAPHNLLTFSEQFDNAAWGKTTTTVAANAIVAPNNTTTGDTLTAGGANSTTLHSYTAIAQPYTFSIYIRRRTGTGAIEITADGSTYVAKTITSDWARYDTTITPTAGTRTPGVRIVTSGDAIDVWGAQLEIGSTATTYNSTTVKNMLGFSELFDNAAWTKSNSFVQTNSVTFSEAFDNAAWTADAVTVTANNTTSPNGYQTADLITPSTATSRHRIYNTASVSTTLATLSVYVKANGYTKIGLRESSVTGAGAAFDLSTGTVIGAYNAGVDTIGNMTIVPVSDGWFRISCSISRASSSAISLGVNILSPSYVAGTDLQTSWTPNGTSGAYFWGAQLVQGSVAGDYRRTDAAALPVYYPNHNGVVCAEKLVEDTVNTNHTLLQGGLNWSASTPYTFSFYAKAGERTKIVLYEGTRQGLEYATINLSTGEVTTVATDGSWTLLGVTATFVGNGFYRIKATASAPVALTNTPFFARVRLSNGSTATYTGDGTSGIYIFGAQLSDSASLDPYVLNAAAAPTAAAYYGARFDYDPVTLAPKGLLIEEQRTNLVLYSQGINATNGWQSLNSAVVTGNTSNGADGTLSASKIDFTANPLSCIYRNAPQSTGTWTFSAWMSSTTVKDARLIIFSSSGSSATANITLSSTLTRYTLTVTGVDVTNVGFINGSTGVAGSITVWGAQLEAGAFATSYIPTAASQVTRAADVATIQGSNFYSWINQNAGSLYAQFSTPASGNRNIIALDDNTANNNIRLRTEGTDPYLKQAWVGTEQVALDLGTVAANTVYKIAASYQINDYAGVIANVTVGTDTVANTPIITMARLGTDQAGAYLNGTIKTFTYYPQKLSADILKGLTA